MTRTTLFSPCRQWRYTLWRSWPIEDMLIGECSADTRAHEFVQFIGLNPSTADERQDDPTVRRCINYAKLWGFGAMCMTNLFGYRATDPEEMKAQPDPIGMENDTHLLGVAGDAGLIVAAWGVHGAHQGSGEGLKKLFATCKTPLHHLGLNSDGTPKHPLYLKKTTVPNRWV